MFKLNLPQELLHYLKSSELLKQSIAGDWSVKGFIDTSKNIYTISNDTKVISKIIELMIIPVIKQFAEDNNLEIELSKHQNHYPDITFIDKRKRKVAMDIKSTYRRDADTVSGFTLGSFTGYFRERESNKNITYPYKEYDKHYILGVIYSRKDNLSEEKVYPIKDIKKIPSVINDLEFIVNEKYQIAKDRPGSGNTKNIGSCNKISELKNGTGPFHKLGVEVFDDYWCNYLTGEMARQKGLTKSPYSNIKEFLESKKG